MYIRMFKAADGVRLAASVVGSGFPLVKTGTWLSHLEHDWSSSIWGHWWHELSSDRTLVRYDARGTGLSQRTVADLSFEALVSDLEAVVDGLALERFDLLGMSQGGTIAATYAARHPERVRRIVIYGGYLVGRARREEPSAKVEAELLAELARVGWGTPNPAFRRVFATLFLPGATPEQYREFDELQRVSASADVASRIRRTFNEVDAQDEARRIVAPTLVAHARHDGIVPFEEGARAASVIPGARFVPIESSNHILLADEPAWPAFLAELRSFLPAAPEPAPQDAAASRELGALTGREREILTFVADGLSNAAIAERLVLSVRTIERHMSNIYTKLGVEGPSARAAVAARIARER